MLRLLKTLLGVYLLLGAPLALSTDDDAALEQRIRAQLSAPGRDIYDLAKDAGRKPVETAQFFGVKAGMTVIDMIAGAGYNTEILSAAVGPEGIVYAQNSHFVLRLINGARHTAMLERLAGKRLPNVRYMVVDAQDMPFDGSLDMAFWGLNLHDIYTMNGKAGALDFLTSIRRALKPGGVLALSDHVGIAGQDNAALHRIEPAVILDLLRKAGFEIEATSDLLANPADDHRRSIYAEGLRYHTDQILVRARKPR